MKVTSNGPCSSSSSSSSSFVMDVQQLQQQQHNGLQQQQQQLAPPPLAPASLSQQQQLSKDEAEDGSERRTNLIVNYLPQTMSQEDIRSLFSTIGDIENCKLIRDKNTGQSLGYGFVNYKHQEYARKAIESLNGLRLQNKTIKVSYARPSCDSIKGANLYVCGFSKGLTQQELENLFSACGNIISARIIYDNNSGISKGVGFVRYDKRHEAERAIKQLNGVNPPGGTGPITVKFANSPSTIKNDISIPAALAPLLTPNRRLFGSVHSASGRLRYSDGIVPLPGSLLPANPLSASGWCLFVYNLAPETEENVLWQLFGPFGAVQNVKVMRDLTTLKCKGYGFVTMTNYDDALLAIAAIHGYQLGNRVLQVSFKKSKSSTASDPTSGLLLPNTGL